MVLSSTSYLPLPLRASLSVVVFTPVHDTRILVAPVEVVGDSVLDGAVESDAATCVPAAVHVPSVPAKS
jgi:hypothetical protein